MWFGRADDADVRLVKTRSHDHLGLEILVRVFGEERVVRLPVVGLHNAMNAYAAYAASRVLGLSNESIDRGLSKARPPGRRMRLSPISGADATLLDDCYNANPASMLAALETLSALAPEGHRLAVLGDMHELGRHEVEGGVRVLQYPSFRITAAFDTALVLGYRLESRGAP